MIALGARVDFISYNHTCSVCENRMPHSGYCPIIHGYALSDGTCDSFKIRRTKT